MFKYFILIIIILVCSIVNADVIVPAGNINGDIWTKTNSPYRIDGNITIDSLIIEPGVEVLFQGNYGIDVNGILIANGFYSDSIYFKPDTLLTFDWQGISFYNDSLNSKLSYCLIEESDNYGIRIENCDSPPIIHNCKFINNNGNGLLIRNSNIEITNCIFRNNFQNGIKVENGILEINNSIMSGNSESGIYSIYSTDSLKVTNCVIAHNIGTGITWLQGYLEVTNSIIYFNNIDIASLQTNTIVSYSNTEDNSISGIGNIHLPPDFIDHSEYYLNSSSPCKNSGNPLSYYNDLYFPPSLKGDRNDMGAYGGALAGNWFSPLYIQPDSINFGRVSYDSSSTIILKIKNYRDTVINVENIELIGTDSLIFSVNVQNFIINEFDSTNLNVTFVPNDQSIFISTLEFETTHFGKFYIPVTGEGIKSEISTDPTFVNFGLIDLGNSQNSNIQIVNAGKDTLRLFDIYTTSPEFRVNTTSFNVNPLTPLDSLVVTFTPDSIDIKSDTLIIINNDPNEGRYTIPLTGQGFGPIINLDSIKYDFGSVFLTSDTTINIFINNNGNDSLLLDTIQFVNNDSNYFRFNDTLQFPFSIDAGSNYSLGIKYKPANMETDSAGIRIQSNDVFNQFVDVSLIGNGISPIFRLNNNVLDFGEIPFNTTVIDSILISNSGNTSLRIIGDSLKITGTDSAFFNIDSVGSFEIPKEDSNYVYVSFNATSEGIKQANLQIVTNDPFNPKDTVQLRGESYAPHILKSTSILNFGNVLKDSVAYLTATIYNNGIGELVIFPDSLFIAGSDSEYFQIDSVESYHINTTDSSKIFISFDASKPEENLAVLNVFSNDPDSHHVSIDLSAFVLVPFISLSHQTMDFGSIPLFTDKNKSLSIYNFGHNNLTVFYDSLEIDGDGAYFFNIDSIPTDNIIQPGDSAKIVLQYSADSVGTKSANLKIKSSDLVYPEMTVSLTGSSATPKIAISDTSIDFGTVPANSDTTIKLIITNSGQGNLIIYKDSFFLTGSDTSSFVINALDSNLVLLPQTTYEAGIEFDTDTVGSRSAKLHIYCNDYINPDIQIDLSGLVFDNTSASISIDNQHSSEELSNNQNGNLRFVVSTIFPTDSVILNYRQGGTESFYSAACTDLAQMNLWEIAIDSSWITSKGFEYFIRVYHGWTFTDWPAKPKSLLVNFDNVEFPMTTQKEVYQKISVPFCTAEQTLEEMFVDNLGNYDSTQYRIFDCINGSTYTEISNMNGVIPPGKSLWLITKNEVSLDFNNAKTVPTDTTYKISLKQGWNMIASPFNFPVNWSEFAPDLELRFYDGTKDWPTVSIMEPFKGYAVNDSLGSEIFIEPKEYIGSTGLPKQSMYNEYDWTINLHVEQGKLHDWYNFAGVKYDAKTGMDKYDYEEPPPIGDYVGLYFLINNASTNKLEKFSSDVKNESNKGYIYDFEVIGNISGKRSLRLEPNSLPEDFQYIVVNPDSKTKYDSDKIDLYLNKNKLQLIVGNEDFINSKTTEFNYVPSTFRLEQNYPNPFNPMTTINYELPGYSNLSATVYNILGQKVKTILNNVEKEPGYYQINWDGKNDFGNNVASGIYVLSFQSKKYKQSIKMIVQR